MQPHDLELLIAQIRGAHRKRMFVMEQRKRMDLALGSFLRLMLGWQKDGDEDTNKAAKECAAALLRAGEQEASGKPFNAPEQYEEWREVILASIAARAPFDKIEAGMTKQVEALAKRLPVWGWAEPIKGFSARFLGTIVAEAGDLSAYPKKGHLWKRMGLAVIDGRRQGGLPKSAGKDEWIVHGYNRKRRSHMYVIGECMLKQQVRIAVTDEEQAEIEEARAEIKRLTPERRSAGRIAELKERIEAIKEEAASRDREALGCYGEAYLARKDYERARAQAAGLTVAPAANIAKIVKANPARAVEFISHGHIAFRAQRYMEKRLLRDLWKAWRAAEAKVDSPQLIAAE